jgi:hypothetical protein
LQQLVVTVLAAWGQQGGRWPKPRSLSHNQERGISGTLRM